MGTHFPSVSIGKHFSGPSTPQASSGQQETQGKLVLNDGKYQKKPIDEAPCRDTAAKTKQPHEARKGIYNVHTLLAELKSCSMRRDLQWGRRIHVKAVECRHESNIYVVTALIRMYGKCGSMVDARGVFDSMKKADVVSWNVLLLGYAENGDGLVTLELFWRMMACACVPNSMTYVAALKACTSLAGKRDAAAQSESLKHGIEIHSRIGCNLDIFVQSTLIDMYGKCGSMSYALNVFKSVRKPNVVCWNALLLGYVENGDGLATLEFFSKMKASGCAPNSVTYVAALKACTVLAGTRDGDEQWLKRGREIHSEISCDLNIFVQSTLIDMYGKYGCMEDARRVFENIRKPDVVSWTALLLGYSANGDGLATLEWFSRMKASGCVPDSAAYVVALKACASLAGKPDGGGQGEWLKRGREIHSEISELNIFVQNTLIDMYAKCGSMRDAHQVFDSIQKPDVVSWTALLMGYTDNGEGITSLEMFSKMKASGCAPNSVTYIGALKACTSVADGLKRGREIHTEIGSDLNIFIQNTLIDMYGKCGSMVDARQVFESIQTPNVVSWNTLLLGYAENGDALTALEFLSRMKVREFAPDSVTYIAALKACSLIGALALGRKFHSEVTEFTSHVVTCLVDLYAKCGSIREAREVFDKHLSARDVSTWTALLTGYGSCGDTVSAFKLFEAMQDQGFKPNAVTFVCMLSCCSHAGLVEKAWDYFKAMPVKYGVTPTVMHYNCMVDILGRANQLNEAVSMLRKMPCKPDVVTWFGLLGACRKWKNVEIGRCAFQSLVDMDKKNVLAYVLMAQIYGSRGMWEEQKDVLESKINLGAWKVPHQQAYAYDEVGNMVKFVVGEQDPPEDENKLEHPVESLKEALRSYVNAADAKKEDVSLCGHSERRAIAYGMLRTPVGEPVRAFKNMRMCEDCHESTKIISKLSERVIMVRDASRLHVMRNGSCSCGDYW